MGKKPLTMWQKLYWAGKKQTNVTLQPSDVYEMVRRWPGIGHEIDVAGEELGYFVQGKTIARWMVMGQYQIWVLAGHLNMPEGEIKLLADGARLMKREYRWARWRGQTGDEMWSRVPMYDVDQSFRCVPVTVFMFDLKDLLLPVEGVTVVKPPRKRKLRNPIARSDV
jgi:hypothetical protein